AFFKALLFLTAGSVMHACAGQLNLFKMSGLRHKMPITCWLMFLGCLALAGVPFTAGFYSKDSILADALVARPILGYLGILTALLTAFYTFRLWFRVFCGPERYEMGNEHHGYEMTHDDHHHDDDHGHHHEPHEMPWLMNAPLIVLAIGAVFAGMVSQDWITHNIHNSSAYVSHDTAAVFYGMDPKEYEEQIEHAHHTVSLVAGAGALLMIALAGYFHLLNRDKADRVSKNFTPLVVCFYNKYFVDEFYDALIRKPLRGLGSISNGVDNAVLDRGIVDRLIGWLPARLIAAFAGLLQRGPLQSYATSMALGVVIILILFTWKAVAS
ncbi:MAG: proton-conducting transporter transmembrane domain-containing protein, partial [Planctomycetota bacterium]